MFRRPTILSLLAAALGASHLGAQQGRTFTTEDALSVRSVRIADVTEDGRRVAATVRTRRDGLGVDHARFGDPTYVAPQLADVLVLDTRTGESRSLYDAPADVRSLAWAPDGDRLAFLMRREGSFGLYVHDARASRTREVVLATGKAIASDAPLEWTPDGSRILLTLRPEGWAEAARRAFVELTAGPVVVQDGQDDFLDWDRVRNIGLRQIPALVSVSDGAVRELLPETNAQGFGFSKDGRYLTYVVATPTKTAYEQNEGTDYEVFRLGLEGGEPESMMGPVQRRPSPVWTASAGAFAYGERGNVLLHRVGADSALDLTREHRVPISEDDTTKLSFSVERWSPDDERLLVTSQQGWYLLDPEAGSLEPVLALEEDEDARPRRDVQHWSEDGRHLWFTYSARDRWERGLVRLDVASGQTEPVVLDEGVYGGWSFSEDGSTVVYERSDGDRPDDVWVARADAPEPTRLTRLNPQLDEVALTRSELVEYLDVDGETLYGVLYYPVGYEPGRRYPLVAEIYEEYFDNGYHESMNLITARGWFGFRPSVELEVGYPGESWLKGVTAGINELIEDELVDPDRLGVHGTSYGGYATNLLITQTDRFAAAINISGKVNIISFLGDSPKITTRNYRAAEIGQDRIGATLWEQPHKYIEHSAVMFADRIETPLLLLSGEGDWNVPATNQREMYYALRRLGKEVVWVHYMNAGHGAGRAGTVSDFHDHWDRIIDWYAEHFDEGRERAAAQGVR